MEAVGSNYTTPRVSRDHRVADRIIRALGPSLRLLQRPTAATFHVLGATCNVYTVTLGSTPTCTCPDRTTPCKHILFVLIRVLGVSPDDKFLRRRSLRPCHLYHLVSAPTRPEYLAGIALRQRFQQLLSASAFSASDLPSSSKENETKEETATCPICLDEINTVKDVNGGGSGKERERAVVKCRVCKNKVHEECMVTWKRSRGRRPAICVVCRARWPREYSYAIRPNVGGNYGNCHGNCYLNLAPYVGLDKDAGGTSSSSSSCGG